MGWKSAQSQAEEQTHGRRRAAGWSMTVAAALLVGSLAACGHTKDVKDTSHAEGQDKAGEGNGDKNDGKGRRQQDEAQDTGVANKRDSSEEKAKGPREAGGDGEANTKKNDTEQKVPIARAPGGLMAEGAVKQLQVGLQKAGMLGSGKQNLTGRLDGPTEQAVRKFQEKNDLPATGVPDRATARALGLDPDELFKTAE